MGTESPQTPAPTVLPRRAYSWLALLASVYFFNTLDRMIIAVVAEPLKIELSLSDTQIGLISGFAFAVMYCLCGIPFARVADRGRRVALISVCLAFWSVTTALTGLARNFFELFLARVGVGVGEAGAVPATHSWIGDTFPPERRAFAIGIFQVGSQLGITLGLASAGIAAQVWGWRATLIAVGLLGLPLALLVRLLVAEPPRRADAVPAQESLQQVVKALSARSTLVHQTAGFSVAAFSLWGISQWIPAFFMRVHHLPLALVGLYGALAGGLGGIIGAILGGMLMTKLRVRDTRWELWLPAISYVTAAPIFAALFLVPSIGLAFSLQFVAALLTAGGNAVALSALHTDVEQHRRATAIAILLMISTLIGLGGGPVAVGALSDALTPTWGSESLGIALAAASFLLLWGAAHMMFAARSRRP